MLDKNLYNWLSQKGYTNPSEHVKRPTHLCMDGGKIYVPDEKMFEFWKRLAEGYNKGDRYFICETPKTSIRKFYIDFDFKEEFKVTLELMKPIVAHLNDLIKSYFGVALVSILCESPSQEVELETEISRVKFVKIGYHLIWSDLFLTEKTSISLCEIVINALNEFDKKFKWDKIVDFGVYKTGLRMIGMWKKTKGKIYKRPYTPVYNYPENPEYFDENWGKYLNDCSIQNLFNSSAFEPVKPIIGNDVYNEKEVLQELTIADAIRSYIRNYIPIKEWDEEILKIIPTPKKTWYIVTTKSRYCANIKGEHNSENIYFQIYTHGFVQKCRCQCNTLEGRHFGLCKNFVSKKYPLSEKLFKLLFPDRQQKQKDKLNVEKNENIFLPTKKLTKDNLKNYLKMSQNTLKNIEKKCL